MEKTKTYLNSKWLAESSELWSDFITDLVHDEVTTPSLSIAGENTGVNCDLEIYDCYFDERGDLYAPATYERIYNQNFFDEEGRIFEESEYEPKNYQIFKTKAQIDSEFEVYKKDHV